MSQVTQALVNEQRTRHARGEHMNLTINEEEQLLWAWEELQHRDRVVELRKIGVSYELMHILEKHALGRFWGGLGERWEWNESNVSKLTREQSASILKELQDYKPQTPKPVELGMAFAKLPPCWPGGDNRG